MARHERFAIGSLDELRACAERLGVWLPLSEDLSLLAQPLRLGSRAIPNRFAIHPMEGADGEADGSPGELAFRRCRRFGAGGSGLIWFEATAVVPEGRANPRQLLLTERNLGSFARLVEATRSAAREAWGGEPLCILQLTHSGRYSRPDAAPSPIIAHRNPILDPRHGLATDYPLIGDDELDALQARFLEAARLAGRAGFDGVDVKACHRYLLSELLASYERPGRYGGSLENRARMLRETASRLRAALPDLLVTTRLNLLDGLPHPWGWGNDPEDVCRLLGWLEEDGLELLNVTVGNPYHNPFLNRPFDRPVAGLPLPEEHPLEGVSRMLGLCAEAARGHPGLSVVSTGYAWLRQWAPYVGAGMLAKGACALVGQGRGAFAYPGAALDVLREGQMDPAKCCTTCSGCSRLLRDGGPSGCVLRDREAYGAR